MLSNIFLSVLDMSIKSGYVIMLVLLLRLFLRKSPKVFSYLLWSVVLFRLICPFSIKTSISMVPSEADRIASNLYNGTTAVVGIANIPNTNNINTAVHSQIAAVSGESFDFVSIAGIIWILGIAFLLIKNIIGFRKLCKELEGAEYLKDNIYLSNNIKTAFVVGIIKPKIYIPVNLTEDERSYILFHEQTHIRRFDHIVKLVAFLTLCIHWFNPLVWAAFFLCSKDMEMSCDEEVIEKMGGKIKKDYSRSLLSLATGKNAARGTPLAFGEGDTKGRIKNVLSYKKPALWIIAVLVVVVALLIYSLITDRKSQEEPAIYGVDSVILEIDQQNKTILAETVAKDLSVSPKVLVSYDAKTSFHYVKEDENKAPSLISLSVEDFKPGDEVQLFLSKIELEKDGKINKAYADTVQASGKLLENLLQSNEQPQMEFERFNPYFPNSFDSETAAREELLEKHFNVNFDLPKGWKVTPSGDESIKTNKYAPMGIFSRWYILNDQNEAVGSLGFNMFDSKEFEESGLLGAVYGDIALSNHYSFDIGRDYRVVNKDNNTETAITSVSISEMAAKEQGYTGEVTNMGILSYNKKLERYAAFELDSEKVPPYVVSAIAESVKVLTQTENDVDIVNHTFRNTERLLKTTEKEVMEEELNEHIKAHKDGSFKPIENHTSEWPQDFPPPTVMPDKITDKDYRIYYEEAKVSEDGNGYSVVELAVWLHIKDDYWYVLEPTWYDVDGKTEFGFSNTGFIQGAPFEY